MEVSKIITQMARIVERIDELDNLQAGRGKNSIRLEEQIELYNQLIQLASSAKEGLYNDKMD